MLKRAQPTKRLIMHPKTGRFLKADGSWTAKEEDAMNFDDIHKVVSACSEHHIGQAEVLLRFEREEKPVKRRARATRPKSRARRPSAKR
jgi:hypothetical protein